jgi:hypothetical protein
MKAKHPFLLAAVAFALAQPGLAADPNPYSATNRAVQIAQGREANAKLMHSYMWDTRTEILVNGTVKDTRIEQVSCDPFGQLHRVTLNDQGERWLDCPLPSAFCDAPSPPMRSSRWKPT